MSKNLLLCICAVFVLLAACGNAQTKKEKKLAEYRSLFSLTIPPPVGLINDYEDLFTNEEEKHLDSALEAYEVSDDVVIAIITLDTSFTSRQKFDSFSVSIFRAWGIGEKGKNNGVLIAISKGYRYMRITNGYGIEKQISNEETKSVINNYFVPAFKRGEYYSGTQQGLAGLIGVLRSKNFETAP